jgi:ferritin
MISKKMEAALNHQIAVEAGAHFTYLSMATWADAKGLEGTANFFYQHAAEEHEHMMKIVHFVGEVGGQAKVPAVKQPESDYSDVVNACEKAYAHEQTVSASIHKLVQLAREENDYVADEFLRWFIDEQREEEVLFMRIMDRIKLIGTGGQSLYYIDKELARAHAEAAAAEAAAESGEG